jgi:serine/threonine protein kinase
VASSSGLVQSNLMNEVCKSLYHEGYVLQNKIGEGGFAIVWEVQSHQYGTLFACKILNLTTSSSFSHESFQAEIEALRIRM